MYIIKNTESPEVYTYMKLAYSSKLKRTAISSLINYFRNMTDDDQNEWHIFKNDPEMQLKLIDEYVEVHTVKNCIYIGFLQSIDPVTHSIILSIPQEDTYQITIIPGHGILNIVKKEFDGNVRPLQRKLPENETEEVISKRKSKLKAWFELNLLPVTELEDKLVVGNVSVIAPYTTSDLYTENPIVAMKIKKVMEKMPDDFSL